MPKEYIDKGRLIMSMNDWMLQNAPVKAGDDTTRADTILDAIKMVEDSPAADVRENDELDELINEAVLTLNNIYIACRIKKDDYVRLLNDICAIRGADMTGGNDGNDMDSRRI